MIDTDCYNCLHKYKPFGDGARCFPCMRGLVDGWEPEEKPEEKTREETVRDFQQRR